ncbi:MAG TPA: hypothetical protein ENN76_03275 [Euryarchaeota archaeon]|nr:hypothetical protein [Euryarchaeota archaeon]
MAKPSGDIEQIKESRHMAEIHQDVAKLRSRAKKYGAQSAKFEKKSLREEWWAQWYIKRAAKQREKAKKLYKKVEDRVKEIQEERKKLKGASEKKAEKIKSKISRLDKKVARYKEKARKRESKAAKLNEKAAELRIKSKTFKQRAVEAENEHNAYMERADLLEKVTD